MGVNVDSQWEGGREGIGVADVETKLVGFLEVGDGIEHGLEEEAGAAEDVGGDEVGGGGRSGVRC